jgi:imidazolonepropionase-like amidohydrolase
VDLSREALARVVRGEVPAFFVAQREDDLLTALRIAKEFGLQAILSQATEGYLVAEEVAKAGVFVAAAPTMQRAGSLETFNACFENAARLAGAGVPVAITSGYESYVPKTRVVLFEAAVAAANGMGWERALRAVTLDAARLLGVDAEYGSIEPGKRAVLACFDGDPFEYTTHVTQVLR